ncbi:MAG: DUF6265 family protein [Bacteroidales bacterium]|nr:DUF6265 family protein [Bacteroidales bacterium]MDD4215801.1 DUF6265 family protein [Bacteroidales bacterium]MDY0142183.1 DUF6265 family protein [Bacteroidales bacterium]
MKSFLIIVLLSLCLNVFSQNQDNFPYWLEGTWVIESETGESYEQWVLENPNLLSGKTYRFFDEDTIVFDTMKIKRQANEIIFEMAANIRNQRVMAGFVLNKPTSELWKFENPVTDSPHNINYWRIEPNKIYVWIETMDNEHACMDFIMIRTNE